MGVTEDVLNQTIDLVKDLLKRLFALCRTGQADISQFGQFVSKLEETKRAIDGFELEELSGLSVDLQHLCQYFKEQQRGDRARLMFARLISTTCFMIEEANAYLAEAKKEVVPIDLTDLELWD